MERPTMSGVGQNLRETDQDGATGDGWEQSRPTHIVPSLRSGKQVGVELLLRALLEMLTA